MPPKKCAPRNAFFYFMLDLKNRQGRKFNSMQEVQVAAGPLWNNMSPDQRKPYEETARREKNLAKNTKFTSQGQDVKVIEKKEEEERLKELHMRQEIQMAVQKLMQIDQISEHFFYVVHVNVFCYSINTKMHYPAEIAVSRFNLKNGVIADDVFHSLVKPGPLPLGYSGEARRISEESHQIHPPNRDEPDNLHEVFNNLVAFLKKIPSDQHDLPPLYARDKDMCLITEVMQQFSETFADRYNLFTVSSLDYLFFTLRNEIVTDAKWNAKSFATSQLDRDIYDHTPNIVCSYHEITDATTFCSKSIVTRLPYIVCDNCCAPLGIELIPGQHVPKNVKVATSLSRWSSVTTCASAKDSDAHSSTFRAVSPDDSMYASAHNLDFISCASSEVDKTESEVDKTEDESLQGDKDEGWQNVRSRGNKHPSSYADMVGASQGMAQLDMGRRGRPLMSEMQELTVGSKGKGRGRGIHARYPTKN